MRKLVIASDNQNKVNEIKEILKGLPLEILSKNEVGLKNLVVEEDGDTLLENSFKKAREIAKQIDWIVVADDTGLFVEDLCGEPGIYSARYAGEDGNDKKNVELLLKKLNGKESKAYFETVISLITEDKKEYTASGRCYGKIVATPRGESGFGYDPVFQTV
jgi:XTP/dITP diphosphohydrolase